MAAKFSRFFNINRNKKSQENPTTDDDTDDEGYQDPITSCPTEPPRIPVPTYPPPRPASPNVKKKADDYQDPWDSKSNNGMGGQSPKNYTYQDPYDTKMNSSREDYADPFDTKFSNQKEKHSHVNGDDDIDDYDEPYEGKDANPDLNSTYEDPWDTKRKIDLPENNDRPRSMTSSQIKNIKKQQKNAKNDYSDPYDSKLSSSQNEENDEMYSEPYDSSNDIISGETSGRRSVLVPEDDDTYDMPFVEKVAIGIADPKKNPHPSFISSNDTPPVIQPYKPPPSGATGGGGSGGGDYDCPWEWNANKGEKEFEKRFSVKEQPKKTPVAAPRKTSVNPNVNPVEKPSRNGQLTGGIQKTIPQGYKVDPKIPLENQGWFHGHIRRGEAEQLLTNQPDCSYLIRNSESSKIDFSLSLKNRGAPMHLKISCKEGKYILGINSRPYDTIPEMIHHYSMNMLNIRGAEHVKLHFPVFQESMYFTVEPGS